MFKHTQNVVHTINKLKLSLQSIYTQSEQDVIKKQKQAYKYLCSIDEPIRILNDDKALEALRFTHANTTTNAYMPHLVKKLADVSLEHNFPNIIVRLFKESLLKLTHLLSSNEEDDAIYKVYLDIYLKNILQTVEILKAFSRASITFCTQFYEENGPDSLLAFINTDSLMNKFIMHFNDEQATNDFALLNKIVVAILTVIANLQSIICKADFAAEHLVLDLLNFYNRLLNVSLSPIHLSTYILLLCLSDGNHEPIRALEQTGVMIQKITVVLDKCLELLSLNNPVESNPANNTFESRNRESIRIEWDQVHGEAEFNLVNVLDALYYLGAISDKKIINEIYTANRNSLTKLVNHGNPIQQEYALKSQYSVAFQNDEEFKLFIKNLTSSTCSKNIQKYLSELMELFENDCQSVSTELKTKQHVFISYCCEDRELCLKIKSDLMKLNYKVLMDQVGHVKNTQKINLQQISNRIEDCLCILMCVSDQYKESVHCRAEVEYGFSLNKPLIPLIMQSDFKSSGWLGIIMGTKIFVNFTKYEYDECIRRLIMEIQPLHKQIVIETPIENIAVTEAVETVHEDESETCLNWDSNDVQDWLNANNFHAVIKEHVLQCDGEMLYELYLIKQEAAEYFYSLISSGLDANLLSLSDILIFAYELENLFNDAC